MKTRYGICGLCFHSPGCGAVVHFDDEGRIERLTPDPAAPAGKVLCPIADSVREIVYSDKRLRQPLKRIGPKGDYAFAPITWEAAYDLMTERLNALKQTHGPETVGFYAGTGSYERSFKDVFQLKGSEIYLASSILFPFGSPNTFGVGAPCYTSLGVLAPKLTAGCRHMDMFSDIDNADLILIWGTDPSRSTPPEMFQRIRTAAGEGAEIIVIDPRKTRAAELPGSRWIPIRPGSDGALALGLAHVLIRDNRYDKAFVEEWTVGFEAFTDYVKAYSPAHVSDLTGIPAQIITDLAENIAAAEGASYVMYTGLEYTKSGVQSIRAVMVLWALAGQLDVPGGRCFLGRDRMIPLASHRQVATPGFDRSIAAGRFPVYAHFCGGEPHAGLLPQAILEGAPYKIRGLLVLGASLLTCWPDPGRWRKALAELDFLVSIDLQLTADAAYADLVLPAATAFEQESYCYYGNAIRLREKMIAPVGQARPAVDILTELAQRLGYGHLYPRNAGETLDEILSASGFTVDDLMKADRHVLRQPARPMTYKKWEKGLLRADGRPGFETPSGKFEISSTILEQYGYAALPCYQEADETPINNPELFKQYPLILGTGPFKPDMKSCFRAIPRFIEKYPCPLVEMNPADAEPRGIKTGDAVSVKTVRGSVVLQALVTETIRPGFVYAQVGGGGPHGPAAWQQANVNDLTDPDQYDPISGFPVYKTLLCQVAKKRRRRQGIAVTDPSLGCVG